MNYLILKFISVTTGKARKNITFDCYLLEVGSLTMIKCRDQPKILFFYFYYLFILTS